MMRSDAKLGMALGMLVIGFAVAFCFPREGRVSIFQQVVQQKQEHLKTEEIEFVPIRDLRDQLAEDEVLPTIATTLSPKHRVELPTDSEETGDDDGFGATQSEDTDASFTASNGLKQLFAEEENAVLPQPSGNSVSQQNLPKQSVKSYRVQAGDTLSGIAMKTLGSYRRYLDIYEANKDQLKSPGDLPLGLELRIPQQNTQSVQNQQPIAKHEAVLPDERELPITDAQSSEPTKRFSSPNRTPFLSDRRQEMPIHQLQSSNVKTHVVQPGDSLERIAVRYFGTARAVQQLRAANPNSTRNPNHLRPGTVLRLIP